MLGKRPPSASETCTTTAPWLCAVPSVASSVPEVSRPPIQVTSRHNSSGRGILKDAGICSPKPPHDIAVAITKELARQLGMVAGADAIQLANVQGITRCIHLPIVIISAAPTSSDTSSSENTTIESIPKTSADG